MKRELDPRDVARRLETLAKLSFAANVASRLEELRALDQLTRYLHEGYAASRFPHGDPR